MTYDSRIDTESHIAQVQLSIDIIIHDLTARRNAHDASKLVDPEKAGFDEWTPKLRALTYGSDEYKAALSQMGVFLAHHYENNDHHPEHHSAGINGMNLIQIMEMLADWRAAAMRHADGDIRKSLEINVKRFGLSEQVAQILRNTVDYLGW